MVSHRVGMAPAKLSKERNVPLDNGDHGPMSQQDAICPHGSEMYPQKFVRLVGCHDPHEAQGAYRVRWQTSPAPR